MLANMPSHIYYDWVRYYNAEPFGEERADLRMGIMTANILTSISAVAAGMAGKKKGRTFKPGDFMPFSNAAKQKPKNVTPEMQFQKIMLFNAALGGTFIDNRKKL